MKRKGISKHVRYNVFRRDGFTCQYCGQKPPEVVLVLDHSVPHSKGGSDDESNLLTSCEACNAGKADSLPGCESPKPDRVTALLEAQQEIAEMQRAHEARIERRKAVNAIVDNLQEAWQAITNEDWCPADDQVAWLVDRYGPEVALRAIEAVARKIRDRVIGRSAQKWVPYLRAVARNMAEAN